MTGAVSGLPDLPSNARYVVHEDTGACFDWGAYAWALAEVENPRRYRYIMFLNSSVRGPFLPAYWPVRSQQHSLDTMSFITPWVYAICAHNDAVLAQGTRHWTTAFTDRLNDDTKLVGPKPPAYAHQLNSASSAAREPGGLCAGRCHDLVRQDAPQQRPCAASQVQPARPVVRHGYRSGALAIQMAC